MAIHQDFRDSNHQTVMIVSHFRRSAGKVTAKGHILKAIGYAFQRLVISK